MVKTIGSLETVNSEEFSVPFTAQDESHAASPFVGAGYYTARNYGKGMEFFDAFQWAMLGVLKAILEFDPSKGWKLSTVVFQYAKQEVLNNRRKRGKSYYVVGDGILSFEELYRLLSKSKQKTYTMGELRSQGVEYASSVIPMGIRVYFAFDTVDEIIFEEIPQDEGEARFETVELVNMLIMESSLTTGEAQVLAKVIDGMSFTDVVRSGGVDNITSIMGIGVAYRRSLAKLLETYKQRV